MNAPHQNQITDHLEKVVSFCQQLVRLPSLPGEEDACAQWVQARMSELGFSPVQLDESGSVLGTWQGEMPGPTIFLDAHMDVVPVTEGERWSYPPFSGQISQGRIYGRGAVDTKGSLAAMLAAVSSLPRKGLRGSVILAASTHEEYLTGAVIGRLLDQHKVDVFITGEPTGLDLAVAQKGRVTLELHASGRSAHTSRPETGINAVYRMLEAVQRLREAPRRTHPLLGEEVLELTEISSEPYPNGSMVPHACHARFIGRTLPGESQAAFLAHIDELLAGVEGIRSAISTLRGRCYTGLNLEMVDFLPAWANKPDEPWTGRILNALQQAGIPSRAYGAGCGTNASAAGERGIPCYIFGPGTLDQAHIIDEALEIHALQQAYHAWLAALLACLSGE